jgi:small subunit ribosomal protein S16
MLAIRLQRFGKTHFATYRVVVQDATKHPTSGKVVAYVGNYNPHTKEVNLDQTQVEKFLSNGAQPSPRVIKLLKDAKIKLPGWVKEPNLKKTRTTRNPDKLRKNRPAEEVAPAAPAEVAEAPAETVEVPVEEAAEPATEEAPAAETPAEEPAAEEPAETPTE